MKTYLQRSDSGTSLIEFALLAPVFLLLMVGLIEVGRYTYYGIVAAHAARAGVQFGSQNLVTAAAGAAAENAALADAGNPSGWKAKFTLVCTMGGQPATCPVSGSGVAPQTMVYYVQVKVTGTVSSLLKYPGIPQQSSITATSQMRVANQ